MATNVNRDIDADLDVNREMGTDPDADFSLTPPTVTQQCHVVGKELVPLNMEVVFPSVTLKANAQSFLLPGDGADACSSSLWTVHVKHLRAAEGW